MIGHDWLDDVYDNYYDVPFNVCRTRFPAHHSSQIDRDVSRGALVFLDKCKPLVFFLFARNLLNDWTSYLATKSE